MPPISWRQRLLRQIFPRRGLQDCCYYHRQGFHAIADAVITTYRQVSRHNLEAEQADELVSQLLHDTRLTETEQTIARMLLDEVCGIQIWKPPGERSWTYANGRHRARALMDAGVRRIPVTSEDARRDR